MMRALVICLVCLLFAVGAEAGDNPDVQIFLEFDNGQNYIEPAELAQFSVYVCFENLGPGGGIAGATLKFNRTFSGFKLGQTAIPPGWISDGSLEDTGWLIGGTCVMPEPSGVVVVGRVDYMYTGTPGFIELLPHDTDGSQAADCSGGSDDWCVRSTPSGHGGVWAAPPPGDCEEPQPPGPGWPHDPQVNLPICTAALNQESPRLISDGVGGVFIVWKDDRDDSVSYDYDIYARRVDASGAAQWPADGVAICAEISSQSSPEPVSDGAGGAIITWQDERSGDCNVYAQRVDEEGSAQWTADGVAICTAAAHQLTPQVISDGAGGVIIAWYDGRGDSYDIYAQRADAEGSAQWTADGVAICTAAANQSTPHVVSDGSGGAIIAWYDRRSDSRDVYAQRVDASGAVQWAVDGVIVATATDDQARVRLVSDGSGGAIITWQDERGGTDADDIYAQRVNASGSEQWTSGGVAICTAASVQDSPELASDGAGGAIITWHDERSEWLGDIYAQHVNHWGAVQWAADGVAVCTAAHSQGAPDLVSDGAGGAVIAWVDDRNGAAGNKDLYAQRVDASGAVQWIADGVAFCTADRDQRYPQLVTDGAGGAIVAWEDRRNGIGVGNLDIYAQRVERNGYLGYPSASIAAVDDRPNDQGGVAVIDWSASYLDEYPNEVVTYYSIWMRRTEESRALRILSESLDVLDERTALSLEGVGAMSRFGWAPVDTVNAYYLDEYALHVPTYGDSTESGLPLTEYMVIAHTASQWVFWESGVASGYSVDNLAPGPPLGLVAQAAQIDVQLDWSPSGVQDEDLYYYNVYRSDAPGVVPDATTFAGATPDTFYVDHGPGEGTWYYVVAAEDVHGNEGPPSDEADAEILTGVEDPDPGLPLAFALRRNRPNPFTGLTSIAYDVPDGGGHVTIDVFDVSGRHVRVLIAGHVSPGRRFVSWDGSDGSGRKVASGVYYCRMTAGMYEETMKMTLTR